MQSLFFCLQISKARGILIRQKKIELELRKIQANDALEGLRDSLGYKSLILTTELRDASSTKKKNRNL